MGVAHAQAGSLQARVMVLPSEGTAPADGRLAADVSDALMRGAKRATPNVARATATLGDTAVIVGCDPAERACVDAVAAALNVDQMLLIGIAPDGADREASVVEVTAVSREAQPVSRRFVVRPATRKQDLAAIEAAVPGMLDAEGRSAATEPGDGDGDGDPVPDPIPDPIPDPVPGPAQGQGPRDGGGSGFAARAPMLITIGGGVLAAAGLVSWGLAASKQGAIDDAPTATEADLLALEALEDGGRRYATFGNGLVIAGGLAAAAGGLWWWHSSSRDDHTPVVTPVVGPDGAGVTVAGRW